MSSPRVDNTMIAFALERVGDLLEAQDGNPYRIRAFRKAADTIREMGRPATEVLGADGRRGLERLPGIGKSLGAAIEELVHTGGLRLLDRLEGEVSPEDLFTTLPSIGEELAHRLHEELGVETLEELELAVHDGRLRGVRGFGPRRVRAVRDGLAALLSRSARRRARRIELAGEEQPGGPEVGLLLEVDARYRTEAEAGRLPRIAPRRFNPLGAAWLPILHTERDGWHMHAMYSNTALAHRLGRAHDWVVIYCERDGHEDQCTVVTEVRGPERGQRVVRGREAECARRRAQRIAG